MNVKSILISLRILYIPVGSLYTQAIEPQSMLDTLDSLQINSDCTYPKYNRKTWKHWIKTKEGYSTRHKVLLTYSLIAPKVVDKKVIEGRWYDPYTDQVFKSPSKLDIDHLVPLGEAHRSGGCHWNKKQKKKYANYIDSKEELIPVSRSANRSKGRKDPTGWTPNNKDYLCEYASNWITVKKRWSMWIDKKEKESLRKIIEESCLDVCIQK